MGLDISLYTRDQVRQNDDYSAASDALYADGPDGKTARDRMSDDEYAAWCAEHSHACNEDVPSVRYPDHLFNRRYLRSPYNGSGFNHAVPKMLGSAEKSYPHERGSLYWIFEPMEREWDGDSGLLGTEDIPKLAECRKRAERVAEELRSCDRLRVITVSPNMFSAPPRHSDDDALRMYREEALRESAFGPDAWYRNRDMEVFGQGLTILAAIPGNATFDVPGVHLIYRNSDEGVESYIQSAEIVAEFCDEAISLIERDGSAQMSWSG